MSVLPSVALSPIIANVFKLFYDVVFAPEQDWKRKLIGSLVSESRIAGRLLIVSIWFKFDKYLVVFHLLNFCVMDFEIGLDQGQLPVKLELNLALLLKLLRRSHINSFGIYWFSQGMVF